MDAQVFNTSWSTTAVFTVSGEPLGSAFLHGNKTRIVPVSQPTASPAAAVTTPTASHHHHRQPDTRTRARGGGGSSPFRIPRTTSRSSRQRGRENRLWRAGDAGASGFGELMVARRRGRRQSESLTPLDGDGDDDEDGDLYKGGDADADDGVWPGGICTIWHLLRR
ncbi:hypothetical protein EDB84DRAFT_1197629 [Lactarius hengduanensis]|nr:hypothetical protein EDB84DRAFT_1197629 [Lactarius hengduanensis]